MNYDEFIAKFISFGYLNKFQIFNYFRLQIFKFYLLNFLKNGGIVSSSTIGFLLLNDISSTLS